MRSITDFQATGFGSRLATLLLAASLLAGCGGAETSSTAQAEGGKATAPLKDAGVPSTGPLTEDDRARAQPGQAPSAPTSPQRTPNSGINPRQQVDVVREEVKGGEATQGPSPFDYLWQPAKEEPKDEPLTVEVPLGLQPLITGANVPPANPLTKAKFELGKQLYFDPRVSKDGTVSCATCHNPEKGWTDQLPQSVGIFGQKGARSAPTVLNTAYGRTMFWDGRAPSLEGQAQGPIQNKIEMGDQSYKEIVTRLREIKGYQEQFRKVFGTDVTLDGMAKAIAAFERAAALSGNSAFDRYNNGDFNALSEGQKRGMVLFGLRQAGDDPYKVDEKLLKKAECTSCHVGFNFTDEQFHNLGVGWDASKNEFKDLGRWAISPIGAKYDKERGAFKTPTLRDLEHTAPYMHDGSEKTLEAVVDFYDRGGNPNPELDKDIKKLNLTAQEKADVVAFLKSLTGEARKVDLPTLPVGPDGKSPDPRAALRPPSAPKAALSDVHATFTR
jgi:cytochrome c peroxidase